MYTKCSKQNIKYCTIVQYYCTSTIVLVLFYNTIVQVLLYLYYCTGTLMIIIKVVW